MISRKEYLEKLIHFKDKELIKIVTGIRRCGKSTLFRLYIDYLLQNGIEQSQIIRINLEDPIYHEIDDYEIDFVAMNSKGIEYYQVAETIRDQATLEREIRGLDSIRDHYPKYLLTMDIDPETSYNGIRKINVLDWLLNK